MKRREKIEKREGKGREVKKKEDKRKFREK